MSSPIQSERDGGAAGSVEATPAIRPDAGLTEAFAEHQGTTLSHHGPREKSTIEPGQPLPTVPGYAIERELGRGGMGVVYKARHLELDRLVALKMILSGVAAGEEAIGRFLAEARAVAALAHPNIVPVFEIGRHEGLPYFTLELMTGGSLADRARDQPLPPAAAAQLVEELTRGMAYAHTQGVIHRDLKPANVLLTADGTPKITDFGLAKRLDAEGQTVTGAILGTPAYMAPEQAQADAARVGPAADIYALGAVLYRLVTGRAPFQAATALETVRQVVADEPVPPRRLQPGCPRDLETIVLTCLHKEPGHRYPSALALAEDLRRYRAGEPIMARPVGRLERAFKWARRNLVVTALLAACTLALIAGTVVSAYFAIDATRQAKLAEEKALEAQNNERQARQSAARSLLAPLGHQAPNETAPLSDPEISALWELATDRNGQLGVDFVDQGTRDLATCRQLANRAAYALHAAVGLNARRRGEVDALLRRRLEEASGDEDRSIVLVKALREHGDCSPETAHLAVTALLRVIDADPSSFYLGDYVEGVGRLARWLPPEQRAGPCARAAAVVIQAMAKARDATTFQPLGYGLAAVLPFLPPAQEEQAFNEAMDRLAAAMMGRHDLIGAQQAALAVTKIAEVLPPRKAAVLLCRSIAATPPAPSLAVLAEALAGFAPRLAAREAASSCAQAARALCDRIGSAEHSIELEELTKGLVLLAPYLTHLEAAHVGGLLCQRMRQGGTSFDLDALERGLAPFAAHVSTADASALSAHLARALGQANNSAALAALAPLVRAQASVGGDLSRTDALQVGAGLVDTVKKSTNDSVLLANAKALRVVAGRLRPDESAELCGQAAVHIAQATLTARDLDLISPFPSAGHDNRALEAQAMSALALRLGPRQAAQAGSVIAEGLGGSSDPHAVVRGAQVLESLAACLGPADASAAAEALLRAMSKAMRPEHLYSLGRCLVALCERLPEENAARHCDQAATLFAQRLSTAGDAAELNGLAQALAAVARLQALTKSGQQCRQAATLLLAAMDKTSDFTALSQLAQGLAALGLGAPSGHRVAILIDGLRKSTNPAVLAPVAQGLSAVAPLLVHQDASVAATALLRAIRGAKDPVVLPFLVRALEDVSGRLSDDEAQVFLGETFALLVRALLIAPDINARNSLVLALASVAERLGSEPTVEAASFLMQVLSVNREQGVVTTRDLALALGGLAPYELSQRCTGIGRYVLGATGPGPWSLVGAHLRPGLPAWPQPLAVQGLVDLLKHPLCVGERRRLVLDELGRRFGHTFNTQWDVVEHLRRTQPDIDFITPPRRPGHQSMPGEPKTR